MTIYNVVLNVSDEDDLDEPTAKRVRAENGNSMNDTGCGDISDSSSVRSTRSIRK